MRHFFCLSLVVSVFFFSGCSLLVKGDEEDLKKLLEGDLDKLIEFVPSDIIPDKIRVEFENTMQVHSGTTPPDISGEYLADNTTLIGSNLSYDEIGKRYSDIYVAFIKGTNGKLSYRERQNSSEGGSDNVVVEVVGSGNNFTAYFTTTSVSNGISNKQSTIISGTKTKDGIRNFQYAFVMLEKGSDPGDYTLVPVDTYRVFNDADGFSENYKWR